MLSRQLTIAASHFKLKTKTISLTNMYFLKVIRETTSSNQTKDQLLHDSLEASLHHKSDMVTLEAARAITKLDGISSRDLSPAITVLQLFLSSSKPVVRFAAVRTLNKVRF